MCEKSKKISVVLVVLFSCFVTNSAFGQHDYFAYQDTIRMQMPNGTTIEYAMRYERDLVKYDRQKLQEEKKLKENIEHFLKRWAVLGITNLEDKKPLFIEDLDAKIKISERSENTTVLFPKDAKVALLVKGKHKLQLDKIGNDVFIYFDKIEQIKELLKYDLQQIFTACDKKLDPASADRKHKRRPLQAWLSVDKNNQARLDYQKFLTKKKGLYFAIIFSPNIENINGSWLPGLEATLNFVLGSECRLGIGSEFKYNFSEQKKTNTSLWLNGRVMFKDDGDVWGGLSLGYLLKQRGDFFDNNKFRLGLPVAYRNFTVTPEFYFKRFFKRAEEDNEYFGVKISFGL
ncbi:MAG: hypothetical protein KGV44_15305 [Flavobacteriaceae bacterium]|nr:hypothetical protein [Flavobacteriaceae bacterium]